MIFMSQKQTLQFTVFLITGHLIELDHFNFHITEQVKMSLSSSIQHYVNIKHLKSHSINVTDSQTSESNVFFLFHLKKIPQI